MSQVWLITGSSRGLGRALADAVLAAGHRLVATARNPGRLSDLVARHGDWVGAVALEVTDERAALDAVKSAVDTFGRLDVLVNNAGYSDLGSIEDTSMKDFRAQIETNLFGVVNVTKAAIPVMRRQGGGHILHPVHRRACRPDRSRRVRRGEVGRRRVLGGPREGGRTARHPGHHRRAGGFLTDFAGSSTTIAADNPVYAATVGAVARFQRGYDGAQPGDPTKRPPRSSVSRAPRIPPLRILLGSDAIRAAEEAHRARFDEDEKWRSLSVSTDFVESADLVRRTRSSVRRTAWGGGPACGGGGAAPSTSMLGPAPDRQLAGGLPAAARKPGSNFRAPVLALALANDDNSKRGA